MGSDPLTPAQRRYNMQRIRARDTKPELLLRRALHAQGFRYRLHRANLPGKPDIVLARWQAVIFVHGCFWHGHNCSLAVIPKTNAEFWANKIAANMRRDEMQITRLREAAWRVGVVWQCALTGRHSLGAEHAASLVRDWLSEGTSQLDLRERPHARDASA